MARKQRSTMLTLALLLACLAPAATQESPAADPALVAFGPYVIRSVAFEVQGITLEMVLSQKAEIKIGTSFEDLDSLREFLADREQRLRNERVLESVEVDYEAEPAAGGGYDVAVRVRTKDSWNIIALPKPQFDSNTGFELSIRARDYNFLGSMKALALNLTYTRDEHNKNGFGGSLSFSVPFQLLGHDWSVGVDQDLSIYPDGTPATSITSIGLGVTFREFGFPLSFTATQGLSFNPEGIVDDPDSYFLTDSVNLGASIPTGLVVGRFGDLSYNPSINLAYNWSFDGPLEYTNREGVTPSFYHSLSFGRVDWEGNLRAGLSASLSNSVSYNAYREVFGVYLDAGAYLYANLRERFGIASRVTGYYRLSGDERTDQGGPLRGILDARIDGEAVAFASLDFPVKLFHFPAHLLIKKNWLDFELQVSPFLDAAVVKRKGETLGTRDFWYSGGLEFIVFPEVMRTFIVRASAGVDLDALARTGSVLEPSPRDGSNPYEFFFGMGLAY